MHDEILELIEDDKPIILKRKKLGFLTDLNPVVH
jgi:hypothetical protein